MMFYLLGWMFVAYLSLGACPGMERAPDVGAMLERAAGLVVRSEYREAEAVLQKAAGRVSLPNDVALLLLTGINTAFNLREPAAAEKRARDVLALKDMGPVLRQQSRVSSMILAVSCANPDLFEEALNTSPPDEPSKLEGRLKLANAIVTGVGLGEALKVAPAVSSARGLALRCEVQEVYGLETLVVSELRIHDRKIVYRGAAYDAEPLDLATVAIFLGDSDSLNIAEAVLRAEVQRRSGPPGVGHPRLDLPLLRLARLLRKRGETYLASVLIYSADRYITDVYGSHSGLRVWPIEEKARLLVKVNRRGEARRLLAAAQTKFVKFAKRLDASYPLRDVEAGAPQDEDSEGAADQPNSDPSEHVDDMLVP